MANPEPLDETGRTISEGSEAGSGSSNSTPLQSGGSSDPRLPLPALLAIGATLIGVASGLEIFVPAGTALKVSFLAVVAILASLWGWHAGHKHCQSIYLLTAVIILSALLVYVIVEPPFLSPQPPAPAAQPTPVVEPPPPDTPQEVEWARWTEKVNKEVEKCNEKDETCLAKAIAIPYPTSNPALPLAKLLADTRAGYTVRGMRGVEAMLQNRVGVMSAFTGAGFAVPNDPDKFYWKARVPEYLVKNHYDTEDEVWAWQLDTNKLHLKIDDILREQPPIESQQSRDRKQFIKRVDANCSLSDLTPAVIRFSKFRQDLYRNRLARDERKRVFVLHLCAVRNLTLEEASYLSGYQPPPDTDPKQGKDKFFVWVYFPTADTDCTVATWAHILPSLKDWLREP